MYVVWRVRRSINSRVHKGLFVESPEAHGVGTRGVQVFLLFCLDVSVLHVQ